MDPATMTLLTTYGIPLAFALAGIVVKHFYPALGTSVLPTIAPASPSVPLQPALPGSPTPAMPAIAPVSTGHPFLDALRAILAGATPANAASTMATVKAVASLAPEAAKN
jgi:hypothetical protein